VTIHGRDAKKTASTLTEIKGQNLKNENVFGFLAGFF